MLSECNQNTQYTSRMPAINKYMGASKRSIYIGDFGLPGEENKLLGKM